MAKKRDWQLDMLAASMSDQDVSAAGLVRCKFVEVVILGHR
jgi:hypothetical protein